MPRSPLSPETLLDIELSSTCSRHRWDEDPAEVLAELQRTAGERPDILAEVAGTWIGFYEDDPVQQALLAGLRTIPGIDGWIAVGRERREPSHRTPFRPRKYSPDV